MTVVRMRISDIMQNLTDSVDLQGLYSPLDWANFLIEKCSTELIELMMEHGQEKPIHIDYEPSAWSTREADRYRPIGWELGNGHHRLAAAILLGWDTILVEDGEGYEHSHEYHHALDVTYDDNGYECLDGPENENGWLYEEMWKLKSELLAELYPEASWVTS